MVERGGDVRFRMMDRLTSERLREVIAENADLSCRIITDELTQYRRLGMELRAATLLSNNPLVST